MAKPMYNTTQNKAATAPSLYETPGGAAQKANEVLIVAKQYSDEKLNVVQTIEQTVRSEMAQVRVQLTQVEAKIEEVENGGVVPPNMVTFEPWNGGESVTIGVTPVDTTAPIVTASVASGSYTSAISVVLSSNEGGNIYYTLNGNDPTTSNAVYFSPILLSANTTLKFFGRDAAGNSSAVQTRTYTITITPDAPDTTAPNNATTLVATSVTQTSLTLSWGASTSSDVAGYEVYRGSTLLTTITGTSYAVSSLTADTSYTFVVKAKDTTGNIASGVSVSVTTLAVIESDTTPPLPVTSLTAGTATDTTIPISWALSGSSDVANYEVAHSTNGTTFTVASATVVSTATTYTITGLVASTAYTVRVVAIDTSGNRSTAVTVAGTTISSSSEPVVVAEDNFNRADGNIGTSVIGGSWNVVNPIPQIMSNQVGFTSASTGYPNIDTGKSDNVDIEMDMILTTLTTGNVSGVSTRVPSGNNQSLIFGAKTATAAGFLTTLTGASTVPAQKAFPWVAGETYRLKLEVRGNVYKGYINGDLIDTYTDSASIGLANTKHGFVFYNTTAPRGDNFKVTSIG